MSRRRGGLAVGIAAGLAVVFAAAAICQTLRLRAMGRQVDALTAQTADQQQQLDSLQQQLAGIELGKPESVGDKLRPILKNEAVFAADLVACGLAEKIEEMFGKLIAGPGAVRATLQEYLRG